MMARTFMRDSSSNWWRVDSWRRRLDFWQYPVNWKTGW